MTGVVAYWLIRVASGAISLLPEATMIRLGRLLGGASRFIQRDRWRVAVLVQARVGGPDSDPRAAAAEVFRSYGRYWAEALWYRPRRAAGVLENIEVEGIEHARQARDAGRGVILAVPHIGNWELVGTLAMREKFRLLAVAEALSNRRMVEWFVGLRESLGIEIVLAESKAGVMARLREAIGDGRAVALLADRDLSGRGVEVTFFGETTTFPGGPIRLALTTGAPVIPAAPFFAEGRGHHTVVLPPLEIPSEGSEAERLAAGTRLLAEAFETLIRRHPTQWHLVQPNWPADRK